LHIGTGVSPGFECITGPSYGGNNYQTESFTFWEHSGVCLALKRIDACWYLIFSTRRELYCNGYCTYLSRDLWRGFDKVSVGWRVFSTSICDEPDRLWPGLCFTSCRLFGSSKRQGCPCRLDELSTGEICLIILAKTSHLFPAKEMLHQDNCWKNGQSRHQVVKVFD